MQSAQDFIREMAEQIREVERRVQGREFIPAYSKLVDRLFGGGCHKTIERIKAGDDAALEFGLVFVEVQPYFFRSQYNRTSLIRALKHARLSSSQAERLKTVLDLEHEKKMRRKTNAAANTMHPLRCPRRKF